MFFFALYLSMPAGNFLYADPSLYDDNDFNRSVIFLTQHNPEGAAGFIINQNSGYELQTLLPELDLNCPVYYGGPVAKDEIFYLHSNQFELKGSLPIDNYWSWGNRLEGLEFFERTPHLNSDDFRIFMGYSGWEAGQLEGEVKLQAWVPVKHSTTANILKDQPDQLWPNQMRKLGGRYMLWSNLPDNPQYN